MGKNHFIGTEGEKEVVDKVNCPNCNGQLVLMPVSQPLFDVQCVRCLFKAQVKTSTAKPSSKIRGATWDIMNYHLKVGGLVPPLLVNFNWDSGQEIRFYPFIPREDLKFRQLSPTAIRANLKMFDYIGLDLLPYFVLYPAKVT